MAIERWVIHADINNPSGSAVGSTVGTQVAASHSSGLYWYLEKAGINLADGSGPALPSVGRIWPGGSTGAPAVAAWWTTDDPSSVPVGAQVGDFVLGVTDGTVYKVVS